MGDAEIKPSVQIVVSAVTDTTKHNQTHPTDIVKPSQLPILTKLHAGYFSICLSLGAQSLLWKSLSEQKKDSQALWHKFDMLPSIAFLLLWGLSVFTAATLSFLYILRCFFYSDMVKTEFLHHIGVNYMYSPWISWLLILQSAPMTVPRTCYQVICWVFSIPILVLDVKLYGQWFTTEKRFLSVVASPVSQVSVIGNMVAAQVIAEMGWKESAVSMFSLGLAHYLILFVTMYQGLTSSSQFSTVQRPAYFLFFAAPSMASLAWKSISGAFATPSKMLFFLSLFLFISLACRPVLFKKSMKRLNVTWWFYSFPLTFVGLASVEYAREVKGSVASGLMMVTCMLAVLVFIGLMLITVLNIETLLHKNAPIIVANDLEARK